MAVAGWGVMLVGSDDKRRTDCPISTVTAAFPGEENGLRLVKIRFVWQNSPDLSNTSVHRN